jgi:hypothetical protein
MADRAPKVDRSPDLGSGPGPAWVTGFSGRERGSELHFNKALCEHELDLEIADVLPHRETLGVVPSITVSPSITVIPQVGVSIATQVLTNQSSNASWVAQYANV